MLSPTHTGTFITCGVWTLLGEAHSAPPWVTDSALTQSRSTSHAIQEQIITYGWYL